MTIRPEITAYYELGREQDRLERGVGRVEALRTLELLGRWLPPAPARVLDVGGAAGRYALPLAAAGYAVTLVDPVPLHVDQALAASAAAEHPLVGAVLGDARALDAAEGSVDAVLLLGPLYHLIDAADRAAALREARRVLRPGGVVVAAAVSRFSSTHDGIARGFVADERFADALAVTVATGVHRNDAAIPGQFTTAYFHRPDELLAEVEAAGFDADGPVAVEGAASYAAGLDELLDDPVVAERILGAVRRIEREPSTLGASAHVLVVGRRTE
ncbi:class I SAM-dependent methyltransferase [Cellulomonas rhizosphaerae]|uniref:Class I SAM-dependent methyltransferase n=1 Tax=Cellulomonas rhizosphaerae TaxID=2293719 RepID=A0A413RPC1_9CELL|nr:class I SAM-dependent methyltransferase [Cellulomonas rhizosphaerae]RHA43795.1 class I SAM-dependent methyltransferase [Cellulomonas rhizosphaerae]